MKTVAEPTFVQTNNVGETKRATIKASAKIFNFFADQIYSDKFTAIWRELVANGVDAQKVTGNTRRPIVTVPSMLDPYAKVRDFGTGMGHEFMMNKFMAFTDASTKENSNDFIGGFGIGSKAPLAYTDQYSIKCFQRGVVRVYSIFKDEEGCPAIAFLSEAETDEPDGVEVAFPVRQNDIHKFSDTVVKTLQYFDPLPVLENTELELNPIDYQAKGKGWGINLSATVRNPKVIVGGVAYPLQFNQIPYGHAARQKLVEFGGLGIDFYLDIGDVNIALNREQVTHDDALYDKLAKIIDGIGDEFGRQMSDAFKSAKTKWEAQQMLTEALKGMDHYSQQLFRKHAQWGGQKITQTVRRPEKAEVLAIAYGDLGWNSGLSNIPSTKAAAPKFRAWPQNGTFHTTTFDMIVVDDAPDKPSLRIRQAIALNPTKTILFIRDNTDPNEPDTDWQQFFKELGSPPASITHKLSSFDALKVPKSTSGYTTRPFKCYVRNTAPYRSTTQGLENKLPSDGGLYVVMDNFSPLSSTASINTAMMSNPANVVWLNKTDYESSGVKNDPKWYSVEEGIDKAKADYRSKYKELPLSEAVFQWASSSELYSCLEDLTCLDNFPKRGPLYQLAKLKENYGDVATTTHSHIRKSILEVDYSTQADNIRELLAKAKAQHPELFAVVNDSYLMKRLAAKNVLGKLI